MKIELDKRKLVLTLFKELKPYRQIQSITGISPNILIHWKRRFLDGDTSWAEQDEIKKQLSYDEQLEIIRLHSRENKSKAELAAQFGVNLCAFAYTLRKFRNQARKKNKQVDVSSACLQQACETSTKQRPFGL